MTIDFELHQQAYELAVLHGLTLDQVAERTGIPRSTITRWSADEGWMADREEYRKAQGEILRKSVLYRKDLLVKGMETLDPQAAYAWATVENVAGKITKASTLEALAPAKKEIKTARDAVDALQAAIEIKVNRLLTVPGELNFSALQDMKKAFDLLDELKKRYEKEKTAKEFEEAPDSMTSEKLKEIIRESYGV